MTTKNAKVNMSQHETSKRRFGLWVKDRLQQTTKFFHFDGAWFDNDDNTRVIPFLNLGEFTCNDGQCIDIEQR